ncbi:unnamed protein product [Urochloa humidicola]
MEIAVHVQCSKAVKPAYGESTTSRAADTIVPLSVFDEVHDEYMSFIHAFHPPSPTTAALEAGLARALAEYREWAGRLHVNPSTGRREILLNDTGVRFVEVTADVALESVVPLLRPASPAARRLHPNGEGAEELMLVQVTRFACGSLVVGHTMNHAIGDGFASCQCVLAWGQLVRGVPIDPAPVHDRKSLFLPRDPPRVEFEHRSAEFKVPDGVDNDNDDSGGDHDDDDLVVTQKVRFSREFISDLKSQASARALSRPYSTMQCVVAHLWRCVTMARGLTDGGEATTKLHMAVNGRARMRCPPVPQGYTGNVVLWAHPTATLRELVAGPLGYAVELVRREVDHVDDAYFRSFIDFIASGNVEKEGLEPLADAAESPDVEVYCLYRVPFYDLDFGGGRQFLYMPSNQPVDGTIYILPSHPLGDGSVEAHVSLFSRDMDAFKDRCCSVGVPDMLQLP